MNIFHYPSPPILNQMANPQLENGYIKIANEIMDALIRTRIPGEARQILDVILRKTYGWHKKEDKISRSQFIETTGISERSVIRGLHKLLAMNLITARKDEKNHLIYSFQKDYEKWKPLSKQVTVAEKQQPPVAKKQQAPVAKKQHTKDIIKNNLNIYIYRRDSKEENQYIYIRKEKKNEEKQEEEQPVSLASLREVVNYFFSLKSISDESWIKSEYSRYARVAKKLLKIANYDITAVLTKIRHGAQYFESKGLDWTLETILKRWPDLKAPATSTYRWLHYSKKK